MKYADVKNLQASFTECFFAFSKQQMEEGKAKSIPEGAEVLHAGAGLFGTQKGLRIFDEEWKAHRQMIIDNCDPQDVYNYEFGNHECGYTGNDSEALEIVCDYFPDAVINRFPAELMEQN